MLIIRRSHQTLLRCFKKIITLFYNYNKNRKKFVEIINEARIANLWRNRTSFLITLYFTVFFCLTNTISSFVLGISIANNSSIESLLRLASLISGLK